MAGYEENPIQLLAEVSDIFRFYFTEAEDGDTQNGKTLDYLVGSVEPKSCVAVVDQIHGIGIANLGATNVGATTHVNLGTADAILATSESSCAIAVRTADCSPIGFYDAEVGIMSVVHGGWRGIKAGIIGAVVSEMRSRGAKSINGFVGPHAGPCCYEFSSSDAFEFSASVGIDCRALTTELNPSLDMFVAIKNASAQMDVVFDDARPACTICNLEYFSYRRNATSQRMALIGIGSK